MIELIERIIVTPIAFPDPPLLNATGAHEPLALRTIVELIGSAGTVGLGEAHGGARLLGDIESVANAVVGLPVSAIGAARVRAQALLGSVRADRAFSPIEVAMSDAFARVLGAPVVDLLGGAVRERVEFSGYLFYKWGRHLDDSGPDAWGEVSTPNDVLALARCLESEHGFRSWKLKGGVQSLADEIAAVQSLHAAFPDAPVRLDPNCRWTFEASVEASHQLEGVVEYLEDPCDGLDRMAKLRTATRVPLATNMLAEDFTSHAAVLRSRGADIVLLDHHVVGGLSRAVALAHMCQAFDIGVSMHSNSHLGISFAAMVHLAAAVTGDTRANDTHYPWNQDHDIITGGPLRIVGGSIGIPSGPGLGVALDQELLAEAHDRYLASGIRERGDAAYARRAHPGFSQARGTWTMASPGWSWSH